MGEEKHERRRSGFCGCPFLTTCSFNPCSNPWLIFNPQTPLRVCYGVRCSVINGLITSSPLNVDNFSSGGLVSPFILHSSLIQEFLGLHF
ncbi:hypothetical protein CICLE_v10017322mg [Citrus x clementina]|uniref:Uncharacterized protein n=1 Tax=Citrus clementina TaxID=85681 RepID=V4UA57_CITCL|nr:hypothetical protein CICLE_v10017322mg [Citrus x clementina]